VASSRRGWRRGRAFRRAVRPTANSAGRGARLLSRVDRHWRRIEPSCRDFIDDEQQATGPAGNTDSPAYAPGASSRCPGIGPSPPTRIPLRSTGSGPSWGRKPPDEDTAALDRVRAILGTPSYRLAEQNQPFLERDEVRRLRFQLEHLKPELLLQEYGIRDTVVVYGSTRNAEPAATARNVEANVEALRRTLAADPGEAKAARKLAVAAHPVKESLL
jgi:hypothetical protein